MNIPKDTSSGVFPAPGTWRRMTADGVASAAIRCPKCETYGSLAGSHDVAADGKVSPSVVCPNCDFHEFVTLDGWKT